MESSASCFITADSTFFAAEVLFFDSAFALSVKDFLRSSSSDFKVSSVSS